MCQSVDTISIITAPCTRMSARTAVYTRYLVLSKVQLYKYMYNVVHILDLVPQCKVLKYDNFTALYVGHSHGRVHSSCILRLNLVHVPYGRTSYCAECMHRHMHGHMHLLHI